MNATLNIGQTIGDFRVEEFAKVSADNHSESYFVSGQDGKKALLKLYLDNAGDDVVEYQAGKVSPQSLGFVPMVASGNIEHNGCSYRYIVRDFIEGKRLSDIIEDGFTLSIADMPGLKNDITKDVNVYIPLYKEVLPNCDLIIYIIDAHTKELGIDVQILRDIVISICQKAGKTRNIIIALNKIDAIGQSFPEYRTNKEYHWDKIENRATPTLAKLITERVMHIYEELVEHNIFDNIDCNQSPAYSAVYAYNLQDFLLAILDSERGYIFVGTVADKVMARWSDKKSKNIGYDISRKRRI
ncbi:MAG: hypothetical protein IKY22_06860 [Bacteroidales bacterium]|nr:hypothetical protein [Bacteroidales bacterium]